MPTSLHKPIYSQQWHASYEPIDEWNISESYIALLSMFMSLNIQPFEEQFECSY